MNIRDFTQLHTRKELFFFLRSIVPKFLDMLDMERRILFFWEELSKINQNMQKGLALESNFKFLILNVTAISLMISAFYQYKHRV